MRRKGGALSLEGKSVSVKGDFFQAKAFKAGASVYVSIQNILPLHLLVFAGWPSEARRFY